MAGRGQFPPTRRGYDVRIVVSALQKALRASDADAALYWAYELDRSGFGNWCWKRLRVIASEDIGPAVPGIAAEIKALHENWLFARKRPSVSCDSCQDWRGQDEETGKGGEEVLYITHAVIMLANAPKCRVVDWAVWHHSNDYVERREVPDVAFDRHTLAGRRMGRNRQHFVDEASVLTDPANGELGILASQSGLDAAHPLDRLEGIEQQYRGYAQLRLNYEEHKLPDAEKALPYNPWVVPTVNKKTGVVSDPTVPDNERPPKVMNLPGMDGGKS